MGRREARSHVAAKRPGRSGGAGVLEPGRRGSRRPSVSGNLHRRQVGVASTRLFYDLRHCFLPFRGSLHELQDTRAHTGTTSARRQGA